MGGDEELIRIWAGTSFGFTWLCLRILRGTKKTMTLRKPIATVRAAVAGLCAVATLAVLTPAASDARTPHGRNASLTSAKAKGATTSGRYLSSETLFQAVAASAKDLAARPYEYRPPEMPRPFKDLTYDTYRRLRPRAEAAIWRNDPAGKFAVLPLPRGGLFVDAVDILLVDDGHVREMPDSASFVDFQDFPDATTEERRDLKVSGWRALFPFGSAGKADEAAVFQGGSYFRALGRNNLYGASARGLAIGTASRRGEEFPRFTRFWIYKPTPDSTTLTAAALLDSPSASGAYLFTITPGTSTAIDVRAIIYPREEITEIGVAPMSSMYLHSQADRLGVDDPRPEVHDSDGLAIRSGTGEWIWRPLTNPTHLEISQFHDVNPRGFGLMQRQRTPEAYGDLEARYERRPTVWVEPRGDWGAGHVTLFEIPTPNEYNDNIVAFWRPERAWRAGEAHEIAYRLNWADTAPVAAPFARIVDTRVGAPPGSPKVRRFMVDFAIADGFSPRSVADVWASQGEIRSAQLLDAGQGRRRLVVDLDPRGAPLVELRAALMADGAPQSETWLFRWTAE